MNERTDIICNYAKSELKLSGLDSTECYNAIINLLSSISKLTNSDEFAMKEILKMIERLIEMKPITPITEHDFCEVNLGEHIINRCTRYPAVYQDVDGKYYDNQAIGFIDSKYPEKGVRYRYQGKLRSNQVIELPYIVNQYLIDLNCLEE